MFTTDDVLDVEDMSLGAITAAWYRTLGTILRELDPETRTNIRQWAHAAAAA